MHHLAAGEGRLGARVCCGQQSPPSREPSLSVEVWIGITSTGTIALWTHCDDYWRAQNSPVGALLAFGLSRLGASASSERERGRATGNKKM